MSEESFEQNGVKVHIKKQPNCWVELSITLNKQHCKLCSQNAVKQLCKEISVPGFRKGHAPENLVRDRFGTRLDKQYREEVVQFSFVEGMRICKTYPRNQESIKKAQIENLTEDSATIHFSFESSPILPIIDLSEIVIPKAPPIEVTEKQMLEVIESIQNAHKTYEECTDHTVATKGDTVKITLKAQTNGEPIYLPKEHIVVLDDNQPKWLVSAIIGMEIDQTKENVVPDTNNNPPTLAITLSKILLLKLPEVNDELAKKVGAQTVEEMREKIHYVIQKQLEGEQKNKQIDLLHTKLLELYPIELPLSLINEEKQARITHKEQDLRNRNAPQEDILQFLKVFEENLEPKVISDIRLYFILSELARIERITLSKAEREAIYAQETKLHQTGKAIDPEQLKRALETAERQAIQRKLEEHVLAKVLAK